MKVNITLWSVDELQKKWFKERQIEYRDEVFGSDTVVVQFGYVDTTNGCVMNTFSVMEMIKKKIKEDYENVLQNQWKRKEKEAK